MAATLFWSHEAMTSYILHLKCTFLLLTFGQEDWRGSEYDDNYLVSPCMVAMTRVHIASARRFDPHIEARYLKTLSIRLLPSSFCRLSPVSLSLFEFGAAVWELVAEL